MGVFVPDKIYIEEQPNGSYIIIWESQPNHFLYGFYTHDGKWIIEDAD